MDKTIQFISSALLKAESPDARKTLIEKQLQRLAEKDSKTASVEFPPGLEWFNSSGPLSFNSNLQGKVVVLDFFTYCCINCMHILPDLEALEEKYSVEDGVVVVGVHSAKFENEKVSSNIKNAILRYNIHHPVVNDHDAVMWNELDIQCWPTLLIVGPGGEPILTIIGEGHRDILFEVVQLCLDHFRSRSALSAHSLPSVDLKESLADSPLLYPGKVTTNPEGTLLAVSDTGHNRVVIVALDGVVQRCIGGTESGFNDGLYQEARFHSPQGLCWFKDVIYVADTENHAIRKIDLKQECVTTIAGTGEQGGDHYGAGRGTEQVISSPWDVVLGPPNEDVLFIAMAGTHQIWGLFLSDGAWLKGVSHDAGICMSYAGSGKEENRNNSYPRKAGFAQPSGLALAPLEPYNCMFVADSESSSIRRIAFKDGAVKNVVGGELDPMNLFAFGDEDGKGIEAKLQHPLGVAWNHSKSLFIADSYNHKIKLIHDVSNRYCSSYAGTGEPGLGEETDISKAQFNEPGGLVVSPQGYLYIADTNNHAIRCIDIATSTITTLKVVLPSITSVDSKPSASTVVKSKLPKNATPRAVDGVSVGLEGSVALSLNVSLPSGSYLTEGAPSAWQIFIPENQPVMAMTNLGHLSDPLPSFSWTPSVDAQMSLTLQVESVIYYCLPSGVCCRQAFGFSVPVSRIEGAPQTVKVELSHQVLENY
nr:NHL repeat-containing protein 2-like isoform X2 [Lytechinus pictus]